jgi:hypothetical protein
MATFCLPREAVDAFKRALMSGELGPRLIGMTSEERRAALEPIVGKENAPDVNGLLESKLLQKNQIHGLTMWARQVAGLKPEAKRDLLARIQRIDHLLTPDEERDFLEDHVRQRLGVRVTPDQAAEISKLGVKATAAQVRMSTDPTRSPFRGISEPAPESEVKYGEAYQDLKNYVDSLKPDNRPMWEKFADVANIPRTILTLGHLSAPLVQGWGMITTKPGAVAAMHQINSLFSENYYRKSLGGMIGHPMWDRLTKGGLSITNLTKNLGQREEGIQSSLVERFNEALKKGTGGAVPNFARAGSRAFTGYLNEVRFYRAVDLLKGAEMAGYDISPGSPAVEDIATSVNNFTGRGSLGGGKLEAAAPLLNTIFFAPRKIAGTVQMFNPVNYVDPRITPTARIAAVRQLGGSLIATAAVLGLATAMGFPVSTNPVDTKFGKIQLPNGGMIDITGGNDIYVRLLARLFSGHMITSKGRDMELGVGKAPNDLGLIRDFLRNKLSPMAAAIVDWRTGTDPTGHPFDVSAEIADKFRPIAIQSFVNFASAIPENYASLAFVPFILFGAGVEPPFVAPPRNRIVSTSRHG